MCSKGGNVPGRETGKRVYTKNVRVPWKDLACTPNLPSNSGLPQQAPEHDKFNILLASEIQGDRLQPSASFVARDVERGYGKLL